MTGRQRLMYRLCLLGVLIAVMAFTAVYGYFELRGRIPDEITLFQDRVENIDFGIPFTQVRVSQTDAEAARVSIDHAKKADGHIRFSMAGPLSVTAQNCGSLQGEVRLFGWLPCKKIRIDIRKGTKVMPAGKAVGLYIHADGVMVLGTGRIAAAGGEEQTPAYNKLQTGDYIYAVNGRKVVTIRDVSRLVQKNGAKQMILSVKRDSGRIQVKLTPGGGWKLPDRRVAQRGHRGDRDAHLCDAGESVCGAGTWNHGRGYGSFDPAAERRTVSGGDRSCGKGEERYAGTAGRVCSAW